MKLRPAALLAGCLVVSGGFPSAVEAQCQRPTPAEIETEQTALFAEADVDGSNALSPEEFGS